MNEKFKKIFTEYWLLLAIIITVICTGSCFFAGSRVHDNGLGTDAVRHEIGTVSSQQQQISAGLQEAESTTGDLSSGIERSEKASREAERTVGNVEETIEQQRDAIADCQRLVRTIRARGTRTAPTD